MIQPTQPAAAIITRTVTRTDGTRPMRNLCRSATTGVKTNVRVRANARGIRISRAKYSAAMVPNSMTIAQLLEFGRRRCEAPTATVAEALRKSTALVAGPLSGRLWKNGRFQKKAMFKTGYRSLHQTGRCRTRRAPEDSPHAFGCQNPRPPVKVARHYSIPGAKSLEETLRRPLAPEPVRKGRTYLRPPAVLAGPRVIGVSARRA